MDRAVIAAIEQLRGLTVAALRAKFRELFGEESKSSNKQFLFQRIAWRMQANAEGGLSEQARHRAAEIVVGLQNLVKFVVRAHAGEPNL